MRFKEEWLMPGAVVPVDAETTRLLVEEIKRVVGVAGELAIVAAAERERLAQSIEQMPFGDTATAFAVYVRNFK